MKSIIKQSLTITIVLVILCGVIYPLAVTGIGQTLFNKQANGSMITYNGRKVGSELLGQNFTDARFFHGRVSAVNYNTYTKADLIPDKDGKTDFNGVSSGGSNLAPSNRALQDRIKAEINEFLALNPGITKDKIPADLLTSSGSGLDPDISVQGAQIQIPLISKTTGLSKDILNKIVTDSAKGRALGIFGEPRVNVVKANLEIAKELNIK